MSRTAPTIKDVARRAGVSVGTASHVLHGKSGLHAAETVGRVWDAARALSYRPNTVARSLVRRRTNTFSVVVDSFHGRVTQNPYVSGVLDGILERAIQNDYQVKLVSLNGERADRAIAQVDDSSADGVVLVAPLSGSPLLEWAVATTVPVVVVGSVPPDIDLPRVDVDDAATIEEAVLWLAREGHRRIGIITGPEYQWSARRRETAYRCALERAGIAYRPEWRFQGDYTPSSGAAGARALARLEPAVTVVVCGNDGVALEAMRAFEEIGVRVPDEVSVLGFDDIEAGRWARPGLTTLHQPLHRMGLHAADMLLEAVRGGERRRDVALFAATLVRRQSVATLAVGGATAAPRGPGRGASGWEESHAGAISGSQAAGAPKVRRATGSAMGEEGT